jgi:large subunit ribosomal protein L11
MAKKLTKTLKLIIKGGAAAPTPPLGPALGQAGVNIGEFIKQFNAATADKIGQMVSILLDCYDDRSFEFVIKTPPMTTMIKNALGIKSGSGKNLLKKVGKLTKEQVRAIAIEKLPDLNTTSLEAAMKTVEGSARSIGVDITA